MPIQGHRHHQQLARAPGCGCGCGCAAGPALRALLACAVLTVASGRAPAQSAGAAVETVVITATRTEAAPFDIPASIDRVGSDAIQNSRLQVNISDSLGAVPGLLARDRQNYAQDVQLSVRGFGARSTFGIRGVRLYVDGIPATLPDGQGQISNADLGSADRIEVLRGPFSALYGNSSGGVLQVFTEDGVGPARVSASAAGGSNGSGRLGLKLSGSSPVGDGTLGYVASASAFTTDGYRDHSAAERRLGNIKLTWKPDAGSTLTLIGNSVALPKAQDPLGLTRAQFDANPRGVDPSATQFDTRKTVSQTQAGVVYEQRLGPADGGGAGTLRALVYDGHRNTEQFQAIPVATQASALHPGGVIVLGRDYRGGELRWTGKALLAGQPFTLVAGLARDTLDEHRVGRQNFVGSVLGVEGALRRDENNTVGNVDQFVQATWAVGGRWTLNAGLRHSRVRFESTDHYIAGSNPDDSGSVRYGATLPVLGVLYAVSPQVHVYANAGRGFETPTLNELAYRPNGQTALNLALQAARSNSAEAGVKTRLAGVGEINLALFQTRTTNEIVTLTNTGGRATYQNAGATGRRGLELSWSQALLPSLPSLPSLRLQLAYTLLDARYRDAFATCSAAPCAAPNVPIAADSRIPGLARSSLFGALAYAPPQGFRAAVEARALSRVTVNDANTDAAAGHAVVGASVGYVKAALGWDWSGFARVDNLVGRQVAGSVIVNEGNGRFFEPAPRRTWTAGLSGAFSF